MKVVIDYLNNQLSDFETQRKNKESLMNSKIIEANEIRKTISKLTISDNDTYNVFSASGSRMEFQNREVIQLKAQENLLRTEADEISDEIKIINSKIEEISIAIAHANSNYSKINNLSNDVVRLNGELAMYTSGGRKINSKLVNEKKSVDEVIDNKTLSDTNSIDDEDNKLNSENEKKVFSSNVEVMDINTDSKDFMEEIANRLYFISRILKFDPVRVRLEIDEIYKSIIKYINK